MQLRRPLIPAALAAIVVGCGDGSGSGHSAADVRSALRAAGLPGFHQISRAEMRKGKQTPGVDPDQIDAAYEWASVRSDGAVALHAAAVTVVVAKDPAVIDRMVAGIAGESPRGASPVVHSRVGNVVVFTFSDDPDAGQLEALSRVRRLVAYLRAH